MTKYRAKPVEVEARQYDGDNFVPIANWLRESEVRIGMTADRKLTIPNPAGTIYASPGSWIIQGLGGVYSCNPHVFNEAYEEVQRG